MERPDCCVGEDRTGSDIPVRRCPPDVAARGGVRDAFPGGKRGRIADGEWSSDRQIPDMSGLATRRRATNQWRYVASQQHFPAVP